LATAVSHLESHIPVVLPTETVYGLAAPTLDPIALARVYALKGRPVDNPLIAHVDGIPMAKGVVDGWDDRAQRLADAFWPGPLTIILPRAKHVPAAASGGRSTLAVRMPDHPVALSLLKLMGTALSAPSANRSGHVSPTCVDHVVQDYADVPEAADLLVLDGGPCMLGLESTVISLVDSAARLLRPGCVSLEQVRALPVDVLDAVPWTQNEAPGSSPRHYATHKTLELIDAPDAATSLDEGCLVVSMAADRPDGAAHWLELPADPAHAEAVLYDLLRQADASVASCIRVMAPPDEPRWRAVRDRLQRAASRC
jgi:L-threonylcarbamoyladenylate synthase